MEVLGYTYLSPSPQAMAMDDAEFKSLFATPDKENVTASGKAEAGKERQRKPLAASSVANQSSVQRDPSSSTGGVDGRDDTSREEGDPEGGKGGGGGRWDKSLGVLCQKFIMVFLVSPVSLLQRTCVRPEGHKHTYTLTTTCNASRLTR